MYGWKHVVAVVLYLTFAVRWMHIHPINNLQNLSPSKAIFHLQFFADDNDDKL